jgi:hypothetical protein
VGTPQFISPEQAQDPRKADTRSDIYSLGATLYAMVTTRPPFEGATLAEIITKVLYQQPAPPRTRNRDVSPEVAHLIERMMLKDPSLRYQTPAQVVADIDMIRGGQSIVPKGFTGNWEAYLLRQRQRKWIRRGVVGLAAALVLGIGGYSYWSKVQREKAQVEVDELATQVLDLPRAMATSTRAEIEAWRVEAQGLKEQIDRREREAGVACTHKDDVELRLRRYGSTLDALDALENERDSLEVLQKKGSYQKALRRLGSFQVRTRGYAPAETTRKQLVVAVRRASDERLGARLAEVRGRTAGNTAEFLAKWTAYLGVLDGDYAPTPAREQVRARAVKLEAAARRIHDDVEAVRSAFTGDLLATRIAAHDFFQLKADLHQRQGETLRAVNAHWEAFRQEAPDVPRDLLTGESGLVRGALYDIEAEVDRQVNAYVQRVLDEAGTMEPDEALERLKDLEEKLARGSYYQELWRTVSTRANDIDDEQRRRLREARAAFVAARGAMLVALRAGDPAALRLALDEALAQPALDRQRRADVEALRAGADALDELRRGALAHLKTVQASGKRLSDVERRAPDGEVVVDKRWTDIEVDEEKGLVRARAQRQGSRPDSLVVRLKEITLAQLRAWANQSESGLSEFTLALIELGRLDPVHDEPGRDLRVLLGRYRALLVRFERMDPESAYAAVVRQLVTQLVANQEGRETAAAARIQRGSKFVTRGKYPLGLEFLESLGSKKGKLRYTDEYDLNRAAIASDMKIARDALERQDLEGLLPGALLREVGAGRHQFLFDMDDEFQLRNFERGFGELERHGSAVTPTGPSEQRLVLLHGVEGILRDRPLSIPTMFDPAEKIVLEVTIWTLGGSFVFGVDIDGVQLAVCSADPNIWKWRLRPEAPLLKDETALPEFDYYGRGRGLAFHAGKDFGGTFPLGWDWPAFGRGKHFERWQDEGFLRDERDSLFAFEPGRKHHVRVVRDRGEILFEVDGEEIVRRREAGWEQRGDHSGIDKRIRHGSGRIQILTWTPMAIDNLSIEGRVMDRWRRWQKRRIEDARKEQESEDAKKKERSDGK